MARSVAFERAAEALRLVQVDPSQSVDMARAVRDEATRSQDTAAASVAERALGLAAVHLGDLATATAHLRSAIALGRRTRSPQLAAEARMTLAFALNRQGIPRRALREIDAALVDLDPAGRSRGLAQRAAIHQQLGHLDDALADYRAALPALRRAEDLVWVQRVLSNRGVLHAFRHEYGPALRDLDEAERVCDDLGLGLAAAFVQENLLLVHRRLGDVPRSLHHLGRAQQLYRSAGVSTGSLLIERSELMASLCLFAEAREAAEEAVADFERTHRAVNIPEARLLLARAAILDGDARLADTQTGIALQEFRRQGRSEWVALARCDLLLAHRHTDKVRRLDVGRLAAAATAAEQAGWPTTAAEVRLLAATLGLGGPHQGAALAALDLVARGRHRGPAARRAKAWYAVALLRKATGDSRGASRAAGRGLDIIEEYRGTIGATDLRANISGLGVDLARVGLRNALERGSARQVLAWAERGRARQVLLRPVLPPGDAEVTQLLAELRAAVAAVTEQRRAGRPAARQVQHQVFLEHAIRDASRHRGGPAGAPVELSPDPGRLAVALGDAALLEFVQLDDLLYAVCLVDGRARLRALGPLAATRDLLRWLPFALLRLSRERTSPNSATAAARLLRERANRLDQQLLRPLVSLVGDRPLVIVPTGPLRSMPWSLLPSCRGRAVTVVPSAALWHRAASHVPAPGHAVAVAGPGLPGAEAEARRVAEIHPGAVPLIGSRATSAAVTHAIPGAALVHFAVHGSVRADNPLFSSLGLADGPLTVYDLERLDRGTDTVVLAACDAGRDVVLAGDELLGLSAAFLARDTRHVVASVVPIPDAATAPFMVSFHQRLAAGLPVATCLASAQQAVDPADPVSAAAAAGFVCLGVGLQPIAATR